MANYIKLFSRLYHKLPFTIKTGCIHLFKICIFQDCSTGRSIGFDTLIHWILAVTNQKPFRILLVDDEPGIRKILRLFLELEGFSVFEAITANQAISVIKKEQPHLVILDVILCGQTGFDVCEWVKGNPETKDVIVFLFTALNQEHDYREGQRVGCDLYLTKPQNPKDIVEKVNEFLSKNVELPSNPGQRSP
jgi:CheY-like chemotaxis protein